MENTLATTNLGAMDEEKMHMLKYKYIGAELESI